MKETEPAQTKDITRGYLVITVLVFFSVFLFLENRVQSSHPDRGSALGARLQIGQKIS